jgi:hypothetical protein
VWFRTYEPKDEMETHLVHQAATADWFLQRATRHLAEVESRIVSATPNPLDWTEEHHKTIARFQRYRTAHLNAVNKHRKAIEDHRKNRTSEVRTEERHAMAQARFKIFEAKNAEPDFDAIFEGMRQKAIRLGRLKPDSPR